jgi:hypothetical protein
MDNVCYDTLGHAYFVEDGGEHDTVFDGNLAASVKPGHVIPSDIEQVSGPKNMKLTFSFLFWLNVLCNILGSIS